MLKKIIIISLSSILFLLFVIFTATLTVLSFPSLLLKPFTLERASNLISTTGLKIKWENVQIDTQNQGFLNAKVAFSFSNLCVTYKPELEKACFGTANISTQYKIFPYPQLISIGPVELLEGNVVVNLTETEEPQDAFTNIEKIVPDVIIPDLIKNAYFEKSKIEINNYKYKDNDFDISGDALLNIITDNGTISSLNLISARTLFEGFNINLDLTMNSKSGFTENDAILKLISLLKKDNKNYIEIELDGTVNKSRNVDYSIKSKTNLEGIKSDLKIKGMVSDKTINADIKGNLRGLSEFIENMELEKCFFNLSRKDVKKNMGTTEAFCDIKTTLADFSLPSDIKTVFEMPKNVIIHSQINTGGPFLPDDVSIFNGKIKVNIEPSKNRLITLDGNTDISFSGFLQDFPSNIKTEGDVNLRFAINKFSDLVTILKDTKLAVPAPFSVFDGTIIFNVKGSQTKGSNVYKFPASLITRLESETQKFDFDGNANLDLTVEQGSVEKINVNIDAFLGNIQIQLPNLSIAGLPALLPDNRILLSNKPIDKKSSDIIFDYDVKVRTDNHQPMKIISNIAKEPVPIALDVQVKDSSLRGDVNVQSFPIEFFRRKADIKKFDIKLNEPLELSDIDGLISFDYTDYVIFINIVGTLSKPKIVLSSKPSLSEEDIWAVLLYGEPYSSLGEDDSMMVGGMSRSAEDKTMALVSLFLLAGTPIQQINYNPDSNMLTAKIKLGKKTSLLVSSSSSSHDRSAGVRHSLGKGWYISTGVESKDNKSKMNAVSYIEWNKRY